MQSCKALLSLTLISLLLIIFYTASIEGNNLAFNLLNTEITSLDLSIYRMVSYLLFISFLIVLSLKNLTFFETFSLGFYTISSIAAILSKKIILMVVFFELMVFSAFLILSKNKEPAVRYVCTHLFAGMILLVGAAYSEFGGSSSLIMIGLLINCACFPFSFWVVDAYPAASPYSVIYLSIFTTKISFLAMLVHTEALLSEYSKVLMFFGFATAVYAIIFASLEKHIHRFLCYNVVGQMGLLILVGGLLSLSENRISCITVQIIASVTYQSLLFFVANAVIIRVKATNFDSIGGLFKYMPIEAICSLVAICSMAAFPGTIGFISKSYAIASVTEKNATTGLYLILFKILNFLFYSSVGLKFFYYIFIAKSKLRISLARRSKYSYLPMIILSFICLAAGYPYLFNKYSIYNLENVLSQLSLLFCTTLLFILLRQIFLPRVNFRMDIDWIFRMFISYFAVLLEKLISYTKKIVIATLQSLTKLLVTSYSKNIIKCKKVFNYNSVSFASIFSLFIMSIFLILICLSH
ncbi:proton-conducting transporter transmembrane domain-containing protein [Wolbachia endosymbiont of Pentidionis agamae]|uniref:proton-conducting transporter transmembrane domain-containing protein n=1 Tax=Wolbachia endosymbiont of Pentidionis agamae TaxID=3110435 RepID=UPI002FCF973C